MLTHPHLGFCTGSMGGAHRACTNIGQGRPAMQAARRAGRHRAPCKQASPASDSLSVHANRRGAAACGCWLLRGCPPCLVSALISPLEGWVL